MLEVRSLTKYYGALPALRDASFVAKPGQILGYLGPNGSGKACAHSSMTSRSRRS